MMHEIWCNACSVFVIQFERTAVAAGDWYPCMIHTHTHREREREHLSIYLSICILYIYITFTQRTQRTPCVETGAPHRHPWVGSTWLTTGFWRCRQGLGCPVARFVCFLARLGSPSSPP